MKSDVLTKCPKCEKETLKRLIGKGGAIIFKGTGFYQTDYKSTKTGKDKSAKAGEDKSAKAGEDNVSKD